MVRVRFAPSPTGSLHLGNALTAVANRTFADEHAGTLLLRIDDTDPERASEGGEEGVLRDLEWLGIGWEEGPVRQSERGPHYREAAEQLVDAGRASVEEGAVRFDRERRPTLLRADGTATYHLASVVDDAAFEITHVIRGKDHLSNRDMHEQLCAALGHDPPEYMHHGLIVGDDGQKLSKRHGSSTVADVREDGIPPEAVHRYLDELGIPRGDVHLDLARLRRLAVEAIAAFTDDELAVRLGVSVALVPALRGARDLREAAEWAMVIVDAPTPVKVDAVETLERFRELRAAGNGGLDEGAARELVRELKAVGGNLRALRLALTGRERGPELWALLAALPRDESLRRVDAAL